MSRMMKSQKMRELLNPMPSSTPMPPKGDVELYDKARKMHKALYKKDCWSREKYTRKIGFQLRGIFGEGVWTFKDLTNIQLIQVIGIMEAKITKHPHLASKIIS